MTRVQIRNSIRPEIAAGRATLDLLTDGFERSQSWAGSIVDERTDVTPEPHSEFAPNPYNSHAWIVGKPSVGEGTWIGAFCVIDGSGGLTIGKGCNVSSGTHIYTHSTARRCVSGGSYEKVDRAPVSIGDHVFIGANAVVLMGTTIGDRAVIGACAVVNADVPAGAIAVGVPARVIGYVNEGGVDGPEFRFGDAKPTEEL